MSILMILLVAYLLAGGAVLAILSCHLVRDWKIEAFERARSTVFGIMVAQSILWPLVLTIARGNLRNPRHLYKLPDPATLLEIPKIDLDGWIPVDPPQCTEVIHYTAKYSRYGDVCGNFCFEVRELMPRLLQRLQDSPDLRSGEEGWLYHWFTSRDSTSRDEAEVPESLRRFHFFAADAIDRGLGTVFCRSCNLPIENDELIVESDRQGRPGWSFKYYLCPERHPLLVVEMMHTLMAR